MRSLDRDKRRDEKRREAAEGVGRLAIDGGPEEESQTPRYFCVF
jgi:hypothetical protein